MESEHVDTFASPRAVHTLGQDPGTYGDVDLYCTTVEAVGMVKTIISSAVSEWEMVSDWQSKSSKSFLESTVLRHKRKTSELVRIELIHQYRNAFTKNNRWGTALFANTGIRLTREGKHIEFALFREMPNISLDQARAHCAYHCDSCAIIVTFAFLHIRLSNRSSALAEGIRWILLCLLILQMLCHSSTVTKIFLAS
jgi:hypothetical protein